MAISRPIASYADEHVLAVVKRKYKTGRTVMSIAIIYRIVVAGPDHLMATSIVAVIVLMHVAVRRINRTVTIVVDDSLGLMMHPLM